MAQWAAAVPPQVCPRCGGPARREPPARHADPLVAEAPAATFVVRVEFGTPSRGLPTCFAGKFVAGMICVWSLCGGRAAFAQTKREVGKNFTSAVGRCRDNVTRWIEVAGQDAELPSQSAQMVRRCRRERAHNGLAHRCLSASMAARNPAVESLLTR